VNPNNLPPGIDPNMLTSMFQQLTMNPGMLQGMVDPNDANSAQMIHSI